jgi:hypothetical protein
MGARFSAAGQPLFELGDQNIRSAACCVKSMFLYLGIEIGIGSVVV